MEIIHDLNKTFIEDKNLGIIDGYANDILVLLNLYKFSEEELYLKEIDNIIDRALKKEIYLNEENIGLWNGPLGFSLILDLLMRNTTKKV
ncbi:hypothetical protein [Facklamia miroungae]|uniref:Lanthionine synthetase C-like protein n=1 Tax=Facklamia miroungae TaxID=120956 RepID=A0A1G7VDF1_9LACT|nr:hypothetical protein [Facklamia miroungae]NKZ30299.1 hypothetical protein [Facklamia miroungae]SDG57379.1 hypothetical protein SAMN05421791_1186 [Facklamia miroungae]